MNSDDIAISVKHISKSFKLPHEKQSSVKSVLLSFGRTRTFEKQEVLKGISFDVKKGEFFGIVGRNGSGKSTLLKLLAGIYSPNSGEIKIDGKLTPFIELGVGFNPELTGRENVYLNGALLGFNRKEMDAMYDEIVDFAELEKFMDQKLKNYSSGMQVRLAFSVAIQAKSDILLLDEVLAVGDIIFQKKCFEYFKTLKKEKKSVILVSHDSSVLEEYCETGILLDKGRILISGKMKDIVRGYLDLVNKTEEASGLKGKSQTEAGEARWGTRKMEVHACRIKSHEGSEVIIFDDKEEYMIIEIDFVSFTNEPGPIYGITIEDAEGIRVFESNTKQQKVATNTVSDSQTTTLRWEIPNVFNTGTYYVSPAVARHDGTEMYDWRDSLGSFKIRKRLPSAALVNMKHIIGISKD